jgi:peptidase E
MNLHEMLGWTIVGAGEENNEIILTLEKNGYRKKVAFVPTWGRDIEVYEESARTESE